MLKEYLFAPTKSKSGMYLAFIAPHTLLPDMYFTSFPAHLSLYTHLLHLCTSSPTQAWSTKGELFGY